MDTHIHIYIHTYTHKCGYAGRMRYTHPKRHTYTKVQACRHAYTYQNTSIRRDSQTDVGQPYIDANTRTYIQTSYIHTHIYIQTCIHAYTYIYDIHTYINILPYMHTHIRADMRGIPLHTYTQTGIHTYKYIHIGIQACRQGGSNLGR